MHLFDDMFNRIALGVRLFNPYYFLYINYSVSYLKRKKTQREDLSVSEIDRNDYTGCPKNDGCSFKGIFFRTF